MASISFQPMRMKSTLSETNISYKPFGAFCLKQNNFDIIQLSDERINHVLEKIRMRTWVSYKKK